MPAPPWKLQLLPVTFRGVEFKVETSTRAGGRRVAIFEYPHREQHSTEDLGRRARRFSIQAYLIGPNYIEALDALLAALEREGPGELVGYLAQPVLAIPEGYSFTESRERGGFATVEMQFVAAGQPADIVVSADTQSDVKTKADAASTAAVDAAKTAPAVVEPGRFGRN